MRCVKAITCVVCLGLLVGALDVAARPGNLDHSFGQRGVFILPPASAPCRCGSSAISDIASLPDGGVLTLGARGPDLVLSRHLADGPFDPTFGDGDGVNNIPNQFTEGRLLVQQDGKVITSSWDDVLTRYNPDGSEDATFGEGSSGLAGGIVADLALQDDGKLLVVTRGDGQEPGVTRFNADGTRDKTFGRNGTFTFKSRLSRAQEFDRVAIDDDGTITVAGVGQTPGTYRRLRDPQTMLVVRLTSRGRLDRTFGPKNTGEFRLAFTSFASDVEGLPGGRTLITGYSYADSAANATIRWLIVRLRPGGRLERSFGRGGLSRPGIKGSTSDAVLQGNRLVAVGQIEPRLPNRRGLRPTLAVGRFLPSGRLDKTFGRRGIARIGIGASSYASAVSVTPDGNLAVGGEATIGRQRRAILARILTG